MDKTDFLVDLQKKLKRYGVKNANDYIDYYSEYLDDLIENGMSDYEAINKIGGLQKVLLEILSDENVVIPQTSKRAMGLLFLSLGLPLWGPVVAGIYIIILAVIFAFGVSALAFVVSGLWLFLGSFVVIFKLGLLYAGFQFGMALILLGLAVICEQLFLAMGNGLFSSSRYIFRRFNVRRA